MYESSLTKEEKLHYDKSRERISAEKIILSETHAAGRANGRDEDRADGEQIGLQKGE